MWLWNRREIYTGFSEADFATVRNVLMEHGIPYDFRVSDRVTPWHGSMMTRGANPLTNQDSARQYYIYVDKKDYERAEYLLRK